MVSAASDCHELLSALREIAKRRTIPLAEIAPLHTEVARLAGRARLADPEHQRRQEIGKRLASERIASREQVG